MKVKMYLPSARKLVESKGLSKDGNVQAFHTRNVLRRIKRYMPFRTGATYKITVAQTDIRKPEIVTDVPYARYLYKGLAMVNAKTGKGHALIPGVGYRYPKGAILRPTARALQYTRTKNPDAGPEWDKTLIASEGAAMTADLQRYIDRRSK